MTSRPAEELTIEFRLDSCCLCQSDSCIQRVEQKPGNKTLIIHGHGIEEDGEWVVLEFENCVCVYPASFSNSNTAATFSA